MYLQMNYVFFSGNGMVRNTPCHAPYIYAAMIKQNTKRPARKLTLA